MAKIDIWIGYVDKIYDVYRVVYQNLEMIPGDIVKFWSGQTTAFFNSISNLSFRKEQPLRLRLWSDFIK